jgi:hypothetical protein
MEMKRIEIEDINDVEVELEVETESYENKFQNEILYTNLLNYYKNNNLFDKLEYSLNTYSLRIIDWFITNYASRNFTQYIIKNPVNGEEKLFKVYESYKLNLKAYSKKRFDPFNRRSRIQVMISPEKYITSTIGQLNFFRWCFENKILEYIDLHRNVIIDDIKIHNVTTKNRKDVKENKQITRRAKNNNFTRKLFHRENITTEFSIIKHTENNNINKIISHQIECI